MRLNSSTIRISYTSALKVVDFHKHLNQQSKLAPPIAIIAINAYLYIRAIIRYSTSFIYSCDFQLEGRIVGVMWGLPPKRQMEKNTWWDDTYLRLTASFEPLCVHLFLPLGLCRSESKKRQWGSQRGRKAHKKCRFHVCVDQTVAGRFQPKLK